MRTVSIDIYNYEELPPVIQERLRSAAVESLVDSNFDSFSVQSSIMLEAEYGIKGSVYYSLSYSQGDGLHFNTDNMITPITTQLLKNRLPDVPIERTLKFYAEHGVRIYAKHNNHHYEYPSRSDVDVECIGDVEEDDLDYFYTILQTLRDIYMEACKRFENEGYRCYDIEEDDVNELLCSQEYYRDGRVYEA